MKRFALIMVLLVCVALCQNLHSPPAAEYECQQGSFVCGDEAQRCILRKYVCDGTFDCQNGKDEENCSKNKAKDEDPFVSDDLNRNIPTFGIELGPVRDIPRNG